MCRVTLLLCIWWTIWLSNDTGPVHRLFVHIRPSEFSTSDAGSLEHDPFYDASQSLLAWLEENTRAIPDIVSIQAAVRARSPALHPSCRRDTDEVTVGMRGSTMKDAVPFQKKKLCLKGTTSHGRFMHFRTQARAAFGGTNNNAIQPSRTGNLVVPRADFKTTSNSAEMSKWRDRRQPAIQLRTTLQSRSSRTQQ